MKGITPVIAVVLLLLITISVVGFSMLFFQRTAQTATQSGEQELEQLTKSQGIPRLEGSSGNKIYLRSVGGTLLENPTFFVAGQKVDATGPASLAPGQFGTYVLNETQLADLPKVAEVRVTAGGFSDSIIATIKDFMAKIIRIGETWTTTGMVAAGDEISFEDLAGNKLAVIKSSGNVGIGDTGPTEKLVLTGGEVAITTAGLVGNNFADRGYDPERPQTGLQLIYSSDTGGLLLQSRNNPALGNDFDTVLYWGNDGDDNLRFSYAGWDGTKEVLSEKMRITSAGNVGIGTASPSAGLQINTSNPTLRTNGSVFIDGNVGIGTTGPGAKLEVNGNVKIGGDNQLYFGTTVAGTTVIDINSNGELELDSPGVHGGRFIVKQSGNVGIGTTSPSTILEVVGNPRIRGTVAFNDTGSANAGYIGAGGNINMAPAFYNDLEVSAQNNLSLNAGNSGTSKVFIRQDGNVGIGTTAPGVNLHVIDTGGGVAPTTANAFTTAGLRLEQGPTSTCPGEMLFGQNAGANYFWWQVGKIDRGCVTNTGELMPSYSLAINPLGGKVGIGTTNPAAKLQITGGDAAISTQGNGLILRATDGTNCFRVTVNNAGALSTASVTCP